MEPFMVPRSLRVLIVESRPLDGMDLEEAVVLADHKVVGWATSLESAITLLEARSFDLAFVDLQIGDADTRMDLSRRLSERGIAVVITTTCSDPIENLEHILGLMPKPFAIEIVQQVLDYSARRQDGIEAEPPLPPGFYAPHGATRVA
jgi:AmiR/NasT family two-component response regulator